VSREPALAGRALAAAALPAALFAAVVLQLTVVNRLPLPGGDAPDLVLLLVVAIAVVTTPMTGALTGFCGGLGLDVAPPATHYAGEYALVFCLAGYGAARLRSALFAASSTGERDPVTTLLVMVTGVAAGEAGKAAIGRLLSDPNVTNAAIRHVLPGALFYDLLLSPFVLWGAARVAALAQSRPVTAPGELSHVGRIATAFRMASAGAAPGLRLAGTGRSYFSPGLARSEPKLRLSGSGGIRQAPPAVRRELRLRLAGTGGVKPSGLAVRREPRLRLAGTGGIRQVAPLAHRDLKLRLSGSGGIRPTAPTARRELRLRLAGTGGIRPNTPLVRREPKLRLSAGRAGSSARTNRAATPIAQPFVAGGRAKKLHFAANGASHVPPRQVRTPGKNWLRGASGGASAVRGTGRSRPVATPRFSARSAPQWSAGNALHNGHKSVKAAPGRGWLRPSRRPRPNWYTGTRSTSWLRRSRNPWRRRRQRLFDLVGGRR